jgi:hypothetical protein
MTVGQSCTAPRLTPFWLLPCAPGPAGRLPALELHAGALLGSLGGGSHQDKPAGVASQQEAGACINLQNRSTDLEPRGLDG